MSRTLITARSASNEIQQPPLVKYASALFSGFDAELTVSEASVVTGLSQAASRAAVRRERKRCIVTNSQRSLSEKQRVAERLEALKDMLSTTKLLRGTMPRGYGILKFPVQTWFAHLDRFLQLVRNTRATIGIEMYASTH